MYVFRTPLLDEIGHIQGGMAIDKNSYIGILFKDLCSLKLEPVSYLCLSALTCHTIVLFFFFFYQEDTSF